MHLKTKIYDETILCIDTFAYFVLVKKVAFLSYIRFESVRYFAPPRSADEKWWRFPSFKLSIPGLGLGINTSVNGLPIVVKSVVRSHLDLSSFIRWAYCGLI